MQTPSTLSQLSHAERDALLLMQQGQITVLQEAVKQLQSRRNPSCRNSSKPPSSDGLNKPAPKSLGVAGEKPTGGQEGHPGSTLCQATQPDKIVVRSVPDQCQACQSKLLFAYVGETRQVFDLQLMRFDKRAVSGKAFCAQSRPRSLKTARSTMSSWPATWTR